MEAPIPAQVRILSGVFLVSGAAAVLYQLVWQRSLFRIYGTNSESVALVVTAFMLGLGFGSLAGGALSTRCRIPLPVVFALLEIGIGLFGLLSLRLFAWIASLTWGISGVWIGLVAFGAVLVPTVLMGATLPLLVGHLVRKSARVGESVGLLYFVNTLGSAAGSVLAGAVLFGALGQSGSVTVAAALNGLAAVTVLLACRERGTAA